MIRAWNSRAAGGCRCLHGSNPSPSAFAHSWYEWQKQEESLDFHFFPLPIISKSKNDKVKQVFAWACRQLPLPTVQKFAERKRLFMEGFPLSSTTVMIYSKVHESFLPSHILQSLQALTGTSTQVFRAGGDPVSTWFATTRSLWTIAAYHQPFDP